MSFQGAAVCDEESLLDRQVLPNGAEIPHRLRECYAGERADEASMLTKQYYVYIMSSHSRVIYVGMTNDLRRRVMQHQQKLVEGFTQKYNVTQLGYEESLLDQQTLPAVRDSSLRPE